jgi:SSS family solute:Na+ symporter
MRVPVLFKAIFFALSAPLLFGKVDRDVFTWSELPPLPDEIGFAGVFAGVVDGHLLVAGGANFPDGPPWDGQAKVWYDGIFLLDAPEGEWRAAGTLPDALAYGISITMDDGLICIGGSDAERCHASVVKLKLQKGAVSVHPLPSLPMPLAYSSGVRIGRTLYVMGGLTEPDGRPVASLWALDLDRPGTAWEAMPNLPGPPRMLAICGTQNSQLFVFSGTDLVPQPDGPGLTRRYLVDTWRFDPPTGDWTQLADMPEPRVAAPGPAIPMGMSHLLIPGGDTGELFHEGLGLKDAHPGFSTSILAYHTVTDTWTSAGLLPVDHGPDPEGNPEAGTWAPVTTPVVEWNGQWIIPSGEIRPGVRTRHVLAAAPADQKADLGLINVVTLGLYLGTMLGIGFYFSRRETSTDRFFRGGQKVPWWAVGLSIYATLLSSITYMALPAKAYTSDWAYLFANLAIIAIAPVVIYLYLPFYRRLNVTSAYEYLEKRFNLPTRLFGSASFILFQLGRMAIVLYLPAIGLAAVSSLNVYTCILLMAVLCILYTMIGGIEAVIWTDVVQTFVLLGGAILSIVLILSQTHMGILDFVEAGRANGKFLGDTDWFNPDIAVASVAIIFLGSLFNNLISYTSSQDVVQRYMATSDSGRAARSIWTNALLALPSTVLILALGTACFLFYQSHPDRLSPRIDNDQILPLFVVRELPVGLAGLVIAGIMAASQSTLSSSLNSVSAAWMTDFHKRLWSSASDQRHLRLAQGIVLLAGTFAAGVACVMASLSIASLMDAYISVIGVTGGALAGLFALGIFTRAAHGPGALVGAAVSIAVLFWIKSTQSVNFWLFGAIGTLTCFVVGYLASRLIPAKRKPLAGLTYFD